MAFVVGPCRITRKYSDEIKVQYISYNYILIMGSNTSKVNIETVEPKNENICSNSDPRSPTPEITRTPLQGKSGGKHNITKNVDLRKTFENAQTEEKLIHNNPILSAVIKNHLQSYDPRSPSQDFERTPIIIASKIDELENCDKNLMRLQTNSCASPVLVNSNCDLDSCVEANEINTIITVPKNLCNEFLYMTLNESIKDNEEPLGSSTVSKEFIENNISDLSPNKPTQLLETNFDFVDENNESFDNTVDIINSNDNTEMTNIGVKNIPVFKILEHDPRSPSKEIERTPIVVPKIEIDTSNGNVEDMSDDSLIKVLQNTNVELRQTASKSQDKNTEEVHIYEDDFANINETPKKCKSNINTGSRTPLSCVKNKADTEHIRSKSANMFYDEKTQKVLPSKIPKRVSQIPRLKSLSKQTNFMPTGSCVSLKSLAKNSGIGGHCENTPPHSHRDLWDKDHSIIL